MGTATVAPGAIELAFSGRFGFGIDQWAYLPFEVPAGVQRIRVTTAHDRFAVGGLIRNVLDLGVFGPAGHDLGNAAGFRGWSGGARDGFVISTDATPGYLAGPIEPGLWAVAVGPVVLCPWGMGWQARVTLERGQPPLERPKAPPRLQIRPHRPRCGLVPRGPASAHRSLRWRARSRRTGDRRARKRAGLHRLHRPQHQLRQPSVAFMPHRSDVGN